MLSPEISIEYLTLARLKIAAQASVARQVLVEADLSVVQDYMSDTLIYRLQSEVLAEHVLDTEAEVFWAKEDVPVTVGRCRVARFFKPLADKLPWRLKWCFRWCYPRQLTTRVSGYVTVPATYWRKFPEATFAYPKELGRPVRFAQLGQATFS